MMTAPWPGSGLLRARVEYENRCEVRCAVELDGRSVFVLTEAAPAIGTAVSIELSFPTLLQPTPLSGRAVQVKALNSPGAPCGFVCELDTTSATTRSGLAAIREQLSSYAKPRADRCLRVLHVEDSRIVRDMFSYAVGKYFASRAGSVVLDASPDVDHAWAALRSSHYDLVLVDYILTREADGAALIGRMRKESHLAQIPVLALSVGGPKARRASLAAGADLFLDKPIVLKDLFGTFELLMARTSVNA